MNVTLPNKVKYSIKDKIMYIFAIFICLFSIVCVAYIEIKSNTSLTEMLDSTQAEAKMLGNKTEEEKEALKTVVKEKFTNSIEKKSASTEVKKIDNAKDIICTAVDTKESKAGSYEVNVVLPVINIDSEIIKKYNKEIEEVFKKKLDSVMKTQNKNIVYTTEYVASINNSILSLMIRSNLKEGANAQRTIIQTYNYDMVEDKEITIEEILSRNNLEQNTIQQEIKAEIEKSQKKVEDLKNLGYTIYSRNPSDNKYQLKNSKQFYCTSNTIYIIYAYGNEQYTSEMDVVVI